jgi:hypothetical protein
MASNKVNRTISYTIMNNKCKINIRYQIRINLIIITQIHWDNETLRTLSREWISLNKNNINNNSNNNYYYCDY